MNYITLNQAHGAPYLSFIGDHCHTSGTYFYCAKPEDELDISEIKALEMLNPGREHVLESLPYGENWTINKLTQLMLSSGGVPFILYADIDYKRAVERYTNSFIDNKDIPIYSIIRMDP